MVRFRNLLAQLVAEAKHTASRVHRRTRLVECQCTQLANFAYYQVKPAAFFNVGFVIMAELDNIFYGGVYVKLVEVGRSDINLVEESFAQTCSGAWSAVLVDWEKLIEVEYNDILETHFALLVKLNELLIYLHCVVASAKTQHTLASSVNKAADSSGNFFCNAFCALSRCFKNLGI